MQKSEGTTAENSSRSREVYRIISPEERYITRLELERTVFDAFWCWLENHRVISIIYFVFGT